jgi:hypothetical protein
MFPSASGSANAAFNPSRYYAEVGQTAQSIPGSSVASNALGHSMRSVYLPMLVVVVLLWALERRRITAMAHR